MRKVFARMLDVALRLSPWLRPGKYDELEQAEAWEARQVERLRRLEWELGKELMVIQSTRAGHE